MLILSSLLYGQDAAYQAGLNMSSSLDVRNIDPNQVPGHTSHHHEGVESYIKEQTQQRFTLHPETDPLFVNADRAINDPHKTMEHVVIKDVPATGNDELIACEQGGEEYIQTCQKHLEIDIEITPEITRTESYCPGHEVSGPEGRDGFRHQSLSYCPDYSPHDFNELPRLVYCGRNDEYTQYPYTTYCNPGCQSRVVFHQPKSIKVTREEWIDGCQNLEALADQGLCQCVQSEIGPKETRTISSEKIERSSWFEKYTYCCLKKVANTCEALGARGCAQVSSRCKERIGKACVLYEQTYRCSKGKRSGSSYKAVGDKTPFCLTGNCADDQYDDNGDFFEAMSQLTVLNHAQKDIRAGLTIFGGQVRACRKHAVGFSDCCTAGSGGPSGGWGQSLGLMGCNVEEKELADWRPQRRCVLVGTYCAEREKLTKICLRKKTSFCCFGNKLSRLIQEQGRAQLGMGWGTAERPDCRGLSPDELSRLDFSNMDLSELFSDITQNFKPPTGNHIAKGVELDRIRANMGHITKNIKNAKERTPA